MEQESSPMGWYYEMQSLGYNYRLTDMQAALASSQLDKLDHFVELRKSMLHAMMKLLANFR